MKLLVTGGFGFIGSNFIRRALADPKTEIVNLDLETYAGNPKNLEDIHKNYRFIKGDIADPKTVDKAMKGCEAAVHFAAETHVDRSILDASAFVRTNVLGTQSLLDAALRHKIDRFIHISTDEVYGSIPVGRHSVESDALEPNSPYAASKASSDLLARSYFVTHKLPVIVTRASNNFGPYQYPEKALPLMISNWIDGLPYPLYGDGLQVRDWLYVEDHCRAIELLLKKGQPGEIYNIGGVASCTNRELVDSVRRIMGVSENLVRPVADRPGHDRRYALNCDKLKNLGFKSAHSFDQALRSTVEWYRGHEFWWRPLKKEGGFKAYYRKQYSSRSKVGSN
jgi:dTDP-glucose 4,6-dehydratase